MVTGRNAEAGESFEESRKIKRVKLGDLAGKKELEFRNKYIS